LVEVLAGREVREVFQVFRAQGFRDARLLVQPLPKVDELAAMRAERPILAIKPVPFVPAGRASILWHGSHDMVIGTMAGG